jgi:hypothetical protein
MGQNRFRENIKIREARKKQRRCLKNEILIGRWLLYKEVKFGSPCRIFALRVGAVSDSALAESKEAVLFGRRLVAVLIVAGAGVGAGSALAQEDLNRGKSAQQLFASDCADCHKNPRSIKQRDNANTLASFLRVHYTASRESAASIAGYLVSLGGPVEAAKPVVRPARPKPAASTDQGKSGQAAKPGEAGDPKAVESKPAEPKPAETKPAESKPAEPASTPATPPASPQ